MSLSFADYAKYSMTRFAEIYPTMGAFLDNTFAASGASWVNGVLIDSDSDQVKREALPALERAACRETEEDEYASVPRWLRFALQLPYQKNAPLRDRLNNPEILNLHGCNSMSSAVQQVPDNVRQDWFNAVYTYLLQVLKTPIEQHSYYRSNRTEEGKAIAVRIFSKAQQIATDAKDYLDRHFPRFVAEFVSVAGAIPLDPDRPDVKGAKYWPTDPAAVIPLKELVQGFSDALNFCYRFEPREGTKKGELNRILLKAAKSAQLLGQCVINDKVQQNARYEYDIPEPIKEVVEHHKRLAKAPDFSKIVDPFCAEIKKAYRLYRRNLNKDIPYTGYPLGESVHTHEPVEMFTARMLRYQHHEQGRDPLRTIVGMLFSVISENGVRAMAAEFLQACKDLPREETYEEKIARVIREGSTQQT